MCAFLTTVLFIATATLANGFEKTTSESTYISEISLNNSLHKKSYQNSSNYQTFRIDFENNVFLKDGKPFQSVSGEFEHFRAHPQKWRQILRTMRAAGLNTVSTYAEWSFHNPHDGQYVWTGMANIEKFVRIAAEEDLLVIFRLGPYINAERNGVGIQQHFLEPNKLLACFSINQILRVDFHIGCLQNTHVSCSVHVIQVRFQFYFS